LEEELVRRIDALEKRLDGRIEPENSRWMDWTPTVDQGGAVAANVSWARYAVSGNTVHLWVELAITGAGVAGNAVSVSGIPAAIQPSQASVTAVVGVGEVLDTGTAYYVGALVANGADDLRIIAHNLGGFVGVTPNFALANGDAIGFHATYER
jgi:hypothetical protein